MKIHLSDGEWKLMDRLWEDGPATITQLTHALEGETGWSKHTIITMLSRLEAKGAVSGAPEGKGPKVFSPVLRREDAALRETEDFLGRVYHGSLSLMVSAMTQKQALSREELDQLYELLKGLEGERHA